jgi:hypothetical protein
MRWIVAVTVAIGLLWAPAAFAGDVRITVGGFSHPRHHHHLQRHGHGHVVIDHGGLEVFRERRITIVKDNPNCWDSHGNWRCGGAPTAPWRSYQHVHPKIVFVVPRSHCFVPGYWTYRWVPQTTWYTVWVPGHFSPDGIWVEGHYRQQPYTTGYYQQLWVPERWAC